MKTRRKFSKEFKQTAIRQIAGGKSAAEVARALEVHPSDLYRWRRELDEHGAQAFTGPGQKRADVDRVAQLERKVGQQTPEIDFLKRALQHVEEQRLLRALSNGVASPLLGRPIHLWRAIRRANAPAVWGLVDTSAQSRRWERRRQVRASP